MAASSDKTLVKYNQILKGLLKFVLYVFVCKLVYNPATCKIIRVVNNGKLSAGWLINFLFLVTMENI